jgi:16S rRNA (guanine527-N7)-methyltransferase
MRCRREFGCVIESQPGVPDLSSDVRARLEHFIALLLERNAAINLTAARSTETAWAHVRDALLLAPYVRGPLIDIGSGGGFPGIVLAIATQAPCTLVESLAKKAAFLRDAARSLELTVDVQARRAEDLAREPDFRERFATATARAVGPATTVLELTTPFLAVGGRALLQRGRVTELERRAIADACLVLGAEPEPDVVDPAGAERRIVIARKVAPSNGRFPRRAGVPAKRPLCWNPSASEAGDD